MDDHPSPQFRRPQQPRHRSLSAMIDRPIVKITLFAILTAIVVIIYLFFLSLFKGANLSSIAAFVLALGCLGLNVVFLRSEKMSLSDIGFCSISEVSRKFAMGLFSGIFLVFVWGLVVICLLSPALKPHIAFNTAAVANLLLFYFFNSGAEELAYRAYAFLELSKSYGRATAIFGTSIVFTLLHVQGGLAWINALAGVLTTALIFGVLFANSKSLPLTLGFHFATNIAQDLFGLRQTPLSLITFDYPHETGHLGTATLLVVAFLNLAVFLILNWHFQKKKPPQPSIDQH